MENNSVPVNLDLVLEDYPPVPVVYIKMTKSDWDRLLKLATDRFNANERNKQKKRKYFTKGPVFFPKYEILETTEN